MTQHFCTICGGVGLGSLELHDLSCPLCQWYQVRQEERLQTLLGDFTPALQWGAA